MSTNIKNQSGYKPLEARSIFKTIGASKVDMVLWLIYNLGFGALPFLLAIVLHAMGTKAPNLNAIMQSGEVAIFVTTLCALSMAFFAEMTEADFWNIRRIVFAVILANLIFSAAIGALTRIPEATKVLGLTETSIAIFSWLILVFGTVSCWYLYAMRLTVQKERKINYGDELRQEYVEKSKSAAQHDQSKSGEQL